jgi:hypothetical protein
MDQLESATPFRAAHLLRPLPPAILLPAALVVWVAGAAYCLGYEELQSGNARWPLGLIWSAYAVLPWLFLIEGIKRWEWSTDEHLGVATTILLLLATGILSLALEQFFNWASESHSAPLALQLMRRLPAIAATILLLLLSRREKRAAARRVSAAAESEIAALRRHAPSIRWIRAADNYLELHLDGQVWTRRITMREAEGILEPLGFVRVHRSFIVNREHVDGVVRHKGESNVRTRDGTLLPIGKAFSGNLRQLH